MKHVGNTVCFRERKLKKYFNREMWKKVMRKSRAKNR